MEQLRGYRNKPDSLVAREKELLEIAGVDVQAAIEAQRTKGEALTVVVKALHAAADEPDNFFNSVGLKMLAYQLQAKIK